MGAGRENPHVLQTGAGTEQQLSNRAFSTVKPQSCPIKFIGASKSNFSKQKFSRLCKESIGEFVDLVHLVDDLVGLGYILESCAKATSSGSAV